MSINFIDSTDIKFAITRFRIDIAANYWVVVRFGRDQFQIPKPFTTIHVVYGEPVTVPAGTSGLAFGEMRAAVQAALDSTQAAAEALATK